MGHDMDRPAVGPILVCRIFVAAATDTGVGKEDVHWAILLLRLGDQTLDLGFLADVAGDREPTDVLGDLLQSAGIHVGHDDAPGAFLGIASRDRLANAAGCAGDDADLVLDLHINLFRRGRKACRP